MIPRSPSPLFFAQGRAVVPIAAEHAAQLQALFEECEDYFDLVFGLPPGPAEVQSAFLGLPDGSDYEDKFLLGVVDDDQLVGHLDVVRRHPSPEEATIGIFLLAPAVRGQGLGRAVLEQLREWLSGGGTRTLRIGLVAWNEPGVAFLSHLGYTITETRSDFRSGTKVGDLLILEQRIGR